MIFALIPDLASNLIQFAFPLPFQIHRSQLAVHILYEDAELKQLWRYAVKWLGSELERKSYSTSYPYSNWSPPAQSNEITNG